ncbi:tyrosine-type recombinase/integrase [Flavobacterium sp.]|uniref:tyrosine-type recombinase/integrase n=1 Tax=Flavobacterium sp. TaxID=239 RepID=UPI0037BF391F
MKVRGIPITEELKLLMQFMLNTFIRPSDLRVIKHENIQIKTNPKAKRVSDKQFLYLTHEKTKTTDTEVVSMPAAVPVYEALLNLHKARTRKEDPTKHYGLKSDYVFFPEYENRTTMMAVVGRQFRKAVETAEITNEGEIHTLYSLRHSAIMYRLIKGDVDTLTLARNARTSQEMIDRFYASRLTALMNLDKLHSFKS